MVRVKKRMILTMGCWYYMAFQWLNFLCLGLTLFLTPQFWGCRWSPGEVGNFHNKATHAADYVAAETKGGLGQGDSSCKPVCDSGSSRWDIRPATKYMSYNGTWCLAPNSELKNVASASLPSSKSIVCRMSLGAHANPKLCREGNSGKHSSNLAKLT